MSDSRCCCHKPFQNRRQLGVEVFWWVGGSGWWVGAHGSTWVHGHAPTDGCGCHTAIAAIPKLCSADGGCPTHICMGVRTLLDICGFNTVPSQPPFDDTIFTRLLFVLQFVKDKSHTIVLHLPHPSSTHILTSFPAVPSQGSGCW